MARGTNTFSLGAGFNITGQEPIDSRLVVGTLSDLTTQETWNGIGLYNGLVVAVTESSTLYVLKNRDDVTNPESWVAVVGDISADLAELTAYVEGLKTNIDQKVDKVEGSSLITSKKLALIDTNASKISTLETTVSSKLDNTATVNGQSFVRGSCTINATHINIKDKIGDNVAGTSIEKVLSNFNGKITDAADAGVQSFGGKTGAITVKGGNDGSTPAVNLTMSNNELQAMPIGVASSAQGEKADTALQNITASSSSDYLTLSTSSKKGGSQSITGNLNIQSIESASIESKGLAESNDVKQYVDNMLVWEELG